MVLVGGILYLFRSIAGDQFIFSGAIYCGVVGCAIGANKNGYCAIEFGGGAFYAYFTQ
ncbi:hypothetical protein [Marinicellulosiphila megalodicopiae]|uniref:hypothetical protein n=1 Tax=Marinicellulosiphila megalodicopiae TaxID=2724896 RepID=UPI003BAFFEDC